MILSKEFRFEASHRLPYHQGKCQRLHGHSWVLVVEVEGPVLLSTGMVLDYHTIKDAVQPIINDLDHRHLGTWEGLQDLGSTDSLRLSRVRWLPQYFNATSENLLIMVAGRFPEALPWCSIRLEETCTCSATLTRSEYEAAYSRNLPLD